MTAVSLVKTKTAERELPKVNISKDGKLITMITQDNFVVDFTPEEVAILIPKLTRALVDSKDLILCDKRKSYITKCYNGSGR